MTLFAVRLKAIRGDETQAAFSERCGIKRAMLCHYETGRREPSLDALVRISGVLGVTTDYLLGVEELKPSGMINASNGGAVAIGPGAQATGRATPVSSPTPRCSKCPYKAAVAKLRKAGLSIPGVD